MHTETGRLIDPALYEDLDLRERKKYIPVTRDLTAKEKADMQIRLYAPCACGSGKKFKFCCRRNPQVQGSNDELCRESASRQQ